MSPNTYIDGTCDNWVRSCHDAKLPLEISFSVRKGRPQLKGIIDLAGIITVATRSTRAVLPHSALSRLSSS